MRVRSCVWHLSWGMAAHLAGVLAAFPQTQLFPHTNPVLSLQSSHSLPAAQFCRQSSLLEAYNSSPPSDRGSSILFSKQSECSLSLSPAMLNFPASSSLVFDLRALSGISGSISIACWMVVFSPQIIENFARGSADGLSLLFIGLWLTGDIFNVVGALFQGVLPTMVRPSMRLIGTFLNTDFNGSLSLPCTMLFVT
jgi:hypothetical protein